MATAVPIRPVPPRMTNRVGGRGGGGSGGSSRADNRRRVVAFRVDDDDDEDVEGEDTIVKASTMECTTTMYTMTNIRSVGSVRTILGAGKLKQQNMCPWSFPYCLLNAAAT